MFGYRTPRRHLTRTDWAGIIVASVCLAAALWSVSLLFTVKWVIPW